MSSQRYERISNTHDYAPHSPPPYFRSRASSPQSRHVLADDPAATDAERTLNEAFEDGSPSDDEDADGHDDTQRLMRRTSTFDTLDHQATDYSTAAAAVSRPGIRRADTRFPGAQHTSSTPYTGGAAVSNDGVFANLNAKPERGEKDEDQPPSYEAAAADSAPPYWETTILAPGNLSSPDEVYIDGLPVGSLFSFIWNGMISVSFQLVGFLLTYLLHTTHAAKNGSLAGLGITLIQYGFFMRSGSGKSSTSPNMPPGSENPSFAPPSDPNSHTFDFSQTQAQTDGSSNPGIAAAAAAAALNQATSSTPGSTIPAGAGSTKSAGFGGLDWLAYVVMIVGWFILIRAASDYVRARRHEMLVMQSPDRNPAVSGSVAAGASVSGNAEEIIIPASSSASIGVPILISGGSATGLATAGRGVAHPEADSDSEREEV